MSDETASPTHGDRLLAGWLITVVGIVALIPILWAWQNPAAATDLAIQVAKGVGVLVGFLVFAYVAGAVAIPLFRWYNE